jgi:predicted adenine nucleotide alpha hydrolase (AANH) superfamily ATPase
VLRHAFERTAFFAHEHGFPIFTNCLGISLEYMQQINGCGVRTAAHYPALTYWKFDGRKKGGSERMIQISRR